MAAVISGYYFDGFPGGSFVLITGAFAILLVFNRVALALEDAARKRRFRGIIQGIFEVMRFLVAIGLVILVATPDAETVLSGFVMAAILIVIAHGVFLWTFFYYGREKKSDVGPMTSVMDHDSMRSYQRPLIFSNACIWLVMMVERWILNHWGDPGDVGGYAAVYQLAFIPMLFVSNFLVLFIEPILYQAIQLNGKHNESRQVLQINNYAAFGILFFSAFLFIVFLFGYPIIGHFFLGVEFRSYSWIFPWLLLAGGCFAAAQQLLLKLSCDMRTDLLAALWGAVAVIAVAAYFIGARYWQLKGLLVAIVVVNVCLVLFLLFFFDQLRPADS
jgi:O-antigen/teichoic acid export membrane protein